MSNKTFSTKQTQTTLGKKWPLLWIKLPQFMDEPTENLLKPTPKMSQGFLFTVDNPSSSGQYVPWDGGLFKPFNPRKPMKRSHACRNLTAAICKGETQNSSSSSNANYSSMADFPEPEENQNVVYIQEPESKMLRLVSAMGKKPSASVTLDDPLAQLELMESVYIEDTDASQASKSGP